MWIVKMILPALFIIAVLSFAFLNPDQRVNLDLFFVHYPVVPLTVVVLISIFIGMLLMFSITIFQDAKMRSEIRKLRKQNQRKDEELTSLRNLPIESADAEAEE